MMPKKKEPADFLFYSDSMNLASTKLFNIGNRLRKAITNQQFALYFQPKVRLMEKKIVGAEALIRWKTEEGKYIPPSDFIPIAEKTV